MRHDSRVEPLVFRRRMLGRSNRRAVDHSDIAGSAALTEYQMVLGNSGRMTILEVGRIISAHPDPASKNLRGRNPASGFVARMSL